MKLLMTTLLAGACVLATINSEPAQANGRSYNFRGPFHHGHHHWVRPRVGVYIGAPIVAAPLGYYGYWGPSYYYPAPPAAVEYVEREPAAAPQAAQPQHWWYYCQGSAAYYPYVNECPGGWQRVAPQPAQQ